jgi:hypothetical protein
VFAAAVAATADLIMSSGMVQSPSPISAALPVGWQDPASSHAASKLTHPVVAAAELLLSRVMM